MVRDPRKLRYSRLFSPLPEGRAMGGETTPVAMRSSKFMGSPPRALAGSNNLRLQHHPAALSLQKKSVVWSPLKLLSMKQQFNRRPSLLPTRSSSTEFP